MFAMDLGSLFIHLKMNDSQYKKVLGQAERTLMGTARKMDRIGKQMSLSVTLPVVGMAAASVKAFSDFDGAMTNSLSIMSDVTAGMRKEMEDTARSLSKNSITSAKELAEGYYFLASAGMDAKQSIAALPIVQQFATAGMFNMATATDLLTDAQTALGLSSKDAAVNMENMRLIGDKIVMTATAANSSVQGFAESLTADAATASASAGIELNTTLAVLGAYANKGKKAAEAGNLFGRALTLLTKASRDNQDEWERLNIQVVNADGSYRNFIDVIGSMELAFAGMSSSTKDAALAQLGFEALAQKSIKPLIGMSEWMKKMELSLDSAGGTMKTVAEKQMTSFENKLKVTKNRLTSMAITIGERLVPVINNVADRVEELIGWWDSLDNGTQGLIIQFGLYAAACGPVLTVLGKVIKSSVWLARATWAVIAPIVKLIVWLGAKVVAWIRDTFFTTANTAAQVANTYAVYTNTTAHGANATAIGVSTGARLLSCTALATQTTALAVTTGAVVTQTGAMGALALAISAVKAALISTITVLGTIALAAGAAFVGWKLGRLISEVFDLDNKLGHLFARLFHNMDEIEERQAKLTKQTDASNKKMVAGWATEMKKAGFEFDPTKAAGYGGTASKADNEKRDYMAGRWKAFKNGPKELVGPELPMGPARPAPAGGKELVDKVLGFMKNKLVDGNIEAAKSRLGAVTKPIVDKMGEIVKPIKDVAKSAVDMIKPQAKKEKEESFLENMAATYPEMQRMIGGVHEAAGQFKQVSLSRFSLDSTLGGGRQQVEARGVESRLDTLIDVTRRKDNFAIIG